MRIEPPVVEGNDVMAIRIERLSPERIDDYLCFFDNTPHDDGIDAHKCYCVCWSSTDCTGSDDSTAESRRNLAAEYIKKRYIQGYLAYDGNRVVGWCNANTKADCLDSRCGRMYLRTLDTADEDPALKIKSVFCFVIAPDMRRKGIAGALLKQICEDAKRDGFDIIETYPLKDFVSPQYDYMGPAKLYEKLGFMVHLDLNERLVMRKVL